MASSKKHLDQLSSSSSGAALIAAKIAAIDNQKSTSNIIKQWSDKYAVKLYELFMSYGIRQRLDFGQFDALTELRQLLTAFRFSETEKVLLSVAENIIAWNLDYSESTLMEIWDLDLVHEAHRYLFATMMRYASMQHQINPYFALRYCNALRRPIELIDRYSHLSIFRFINNIDPELFSSEARKHRISPLHLASILVFNSRIDSPTSSTSTLILLNDAITNFYLVVSPDMLQRSWSTTLDATRLFAFDMLRNSQYRVNEDVTLCYGLCRHTYTQMNFLLEHVHILARSYIYTNLYCETYNRLFTLLNSCDENQQIHNVDTTLPSTVTVMNCGSIDNVAVTATTTTTKTMTDTSNNKCQSNVSYPPNDTSNTPSKTANSFTEFMPNGRHLFILVPAQFMHTLANNSDWGLLNELQCEEMHGLWLSHWLPYYRQIAYDEKRYRPAKEIMKEIILQMLNRSNITLVFADKQYRQYSYRCILTQDGLTIPLYESQKLGLTTPSNINNYFIQCSGQSVIVNLAGAFNYKCYNRCTSPYTYLIEDLCLIDGLWSKVQETNNVIAEYCFAMGFLATWSSLIQNNNSKRLEVGLSFIGLYDMALLFDRLDDIHVLAACVGEFLYMGAMAANHSMTLAKLNLQQPSPQPQKNKYKNNCAVSNNGGGNNHPYNTDNPSINGANINNFISNNPTCYERGELSFQAYLPILLPQATEIPEINITKTANTHNNNNTLPNSRNDCSSAQKSKSPELTSPINVSPLWEFFKSYDTRNLVSQHVTAFRCNPKVASYFSVSDCAVLQNRIDTWTGRNVEMPYGLSTILLTRSPHIWQMAYEKNQQIPSIERQLDVYRALLPFCDTSMDVTVVFSRQKQTIAHKMEQITQILLEFCTPLNKCASFSIIQI